MPSFQRKKQPIIMTLCVFYLVQTFGDSFRYLAWILSSRRCLILKVPLNELEPKGTKFWDYFPFLPGYSRVLQAWLCLEDYVFIDVSISYRLNLAHDTGGHKEFSFLCYWSIWLVTLFNGNLWSQKILIKHKYSIWKLEFLPLIFQPFTHENTILLNGF